MIFLTVHLIPILALVAAGFATMLHAVLVFIALSKTSDLWINLSLLLGFFLMMSLVLAYLAEFFQIIETPQSFLVIRSVGIFGINLQAMYALLLVRESLRLERVNRVSSRVEELKLRLREHEEELRSLRSKGTS